MRTGLNTYMQFSTNKLGEPYGGFCTCTVGLIYYWKKQLCLERNQKNNLTKVVYFTGGHTLADGITLEYPNFENLID
jgi:hypothetical protein